MDKHKEIIMKTERTISAVGGSNCLYIPSEIMEKAKWEQGNTVILSLEKGKKGMFLAVWRE
jgi:hypothetical protein